MANLTDKLVQLRDELQADREQNRLTNEGEVLLQNLQSGIATESIGSALQGLSLNLSDEGIGWLRSFFSDVPEQTAGMLRQLPQPIDISPQQAGAAIERVGLETYRQQFPGRAFGAELAGGMAPAIVSRGKTAPESLFMAGTKAGGFGAVSGYGASEGDLGTQAYDALTGASISALATPALQLAGRATGKLYKSVVDGMFASPNRMGKDAARDAIRSALEADVGSVDEAMQIVLSKAGKPYSLADIGPNTRAYLDAANVLPGPGKQAAKEFLEKRDKGIAARLTSDIQDAFGSRASFFDEFNALKEARSDLGGKLYKRALSKQIPVTTELTALLKRPSLEDAYSRGITIARERGMPVPKTRIENGKLVTDDGEVIAPPAPGLSFGDQFGDVDPDLVRRGGDEELTFGDIEPTGALIPFALPVGADEDTDADVEAVVNGGGESAPAVDDAFEQDKWLALAQAGLSLMSSQQPTIGGAIGEAGLSGITALRQARGERDERIERQQARADRLAAAAAAAAKGIITGTERATYFKAAQDATKEAEDLAFDLATGGVAGDLGIVTPYTDEEKEILQRRLNDARTRANRFGALANPALVNFDATLEETTE